MFSLGNLMGLLGLLPCFSLKGSTGILPRPLYHKIELMILIHRTVKMKSTLGSKEGYHLIPNLVKKITSQSIVLQVPYPFTNFQEEYLPQYRQHVV